MEESQLSPECSEKNSTIEKLRQDMVGRRLYGSAGIAALRSSRPRYPLAEVVLRIANDRPLCSHLLEQAIVVALDYLNGSWRVPAGPATHA